MPVHKERLPALTVFLGSCLLFGVQPMLGRTLLPSFGGSAAVWTVSLAAFQTLLLLGYFYAHVLVARPPATQRRLHTVFLGAAVVWAALFAALRPMLSGRFGDGASPSLEVLFCVVAFAGLPYVLLSANSTLVQAWMAAKTAAETGDNGKPARQVYRLYAVSNLGSLCGLIAYPVLLEPFVSLTVQWYGFAAGVLIYTLLLAGLARTTIHCATGSSQGTDSLAVSRNALDYGLPSALTRPCLWFVLPALSCFLLNAVTTHLTTDVVPVPLIWVLLLTAFLLSYIVGFSIIGEKGLIVWAGMTVLALCGVSAAGFLPGLSGFVPDLALGLATVFLGGTFLHGWLYRIRPGTSHLTRFYLGLASGGALGGVLSSLVAPVCFDRVLEYPLALAAIAGVCAWLVYTWQHPELKSLNTVLLVLCAIVFVAVFGQTARGDKAVIRRARCFYGTLTVKERRAKVPTAEGVTLFSHQLHHGSTLHGVQVINTALKRQPSTYYGWFSGGGLALREHDKYQTGAPMRVGLVGLGIGTLACYGRTNDLYRFYEINPQVVAIATDTNLFTYLSDSAAKVEVVLGDARKRLEAERAAGEARYDVLVVDAYSGDAVPLHLATFEAVRLYSERLAEGGTLAVHISNWHIDLQPLCKAMAQKFGMKITGVKSAQQDLAVEAHWVLMTRSNKELDLGTSRTVDWSHVRDITLPTDECGSLISLVRFRWGTRGHRMDLIFEEMKAFGPPSGRGRFSDYP